MGMLKMLILGISTGAPVPIHALLIKLVAASL